jgi:hypothetical protein
MTIVHLFSLPSQKSWEHRGKAGEKRKKKTDLVRKKKKIGNKNGGFRFPGIKPKIF